MKKRIFSRKKAKKRHEKAPEDSILMVRETLYRSLPHATAHTHKPRKTEGKKLHQTKN